MRLGYNQTAVVLLAASVLFSSGFRNLHAQNEKVIRERGVLESANTVAIRSQIPDQAKIVFIASEGAAVKKGDVLVVMEAMKMEHSLTAPRDGTISEVIAAAGQQVQAGAALLRLEDAE